MEASSHSLYKSNHIYDLAKQDFFDPQSKVRAELGDNYVYDCSAHKILHDIHVGRLLAHRDC